MIAQSTLRQHQNARYVALLLDYVILAIRHDEMEPLFSLVERWVVGRHAPSPDEQESSQ